VARRSTVPVLPTAPPAPPQLITLHEAAELLALSYWAARSLVLRGYLAAIRLPASRDGRGKDHRRIMISVADLETFIERHREMRPVVVTNPRRRTKAHRPAEVRA